MADSGRTLSPSVQTQRGPTRPLTQVVSTYVRPAETSTATSSLLRSLGVGASQFLARQKKLSDEEDHAQGVLEGLKVSAETDPSKIKAGEMYAQRSEAFMAGLAESQGKAWAFNKINSWNTEYAEWGDKNSNDPEAFKAWMSERLQEATSAIGDDQFSIRGALPVLQMGLNRLSQGHAEYTSKRVMQDDVTAMQETVVGVMENQDWRVDPEGLGMVQMIASEADLRVAKGHDGTSINDTLVGDVIAFADAKNDTRYLEALQKGHEEGVYRLSAKQQDAVADQVYKIDSEINAIATQNRLAAAAYADQQAAAALKEYAGALAADPMTMPSESILAANPELYGDMLALRGKIITGMNATSARAEAFGLTSWYVILEDLENQSAPLAVKQRAFMDHLRTNPNAQYSEATIGRIMHRLETGSDKKNPVNDPVLKTRMRSTSDLLKSLDDGLGLTSDSVTAWSSVFTNEYQRLASGLDPDIIKDPERLEKAHASIATSALRTTVAGSPDLMERLMSNDEESRGTRDALRSLGLGAVLDDFQRQREAELKALDAAAAQKEAELEQARQELLRRMESEAEVSTEDDAEPSTESPGVQPSTTIPRPGGVSLLPRDDIGRRRRDRQ